MTIANVGILAAAFRALATHYVQGDHDRYLRKRDELIAYAAKECGASKEQMAVTISLAGWSRP